MAFSSLPLYLDQSSLNQPYPHHESDGIQYSQALAPPAPAVAQVGPGGGQGTIRPGSMVDRARLARIPLPENGLKCPRCDSTSTKFCYFNNYSLTQPRHFCKTCRRYWTRGGAMRNVPVGGGCRRNKRSKNTSSKPDETTATQEKQSGLTLVSGNSSARGGGGACLTSSERVGSSGNFSTHLLPPLLTNTTFQAGLSNFGGSRDSRCYFPVPQLGATDGNDNGGGFGNTDANKNNLSLISAAGEGEPWKFLSSLSGFESLPPPTSTNIFLNQVEGTQTPSGKVEDSQGLNDNYSTRLFLGSMENSQFWVGGGVSNSSWTGGYSGHFNSSSTAHRLL